MIRAALALLQWLLGLFTHRADDRSAKEKDEYAALTEEEKRQRALRSMEQIQQHLLDQPVDYDKRDYFSKR